MTTVLDTVNSMYNNYNGTGMQMALFFACIIYLWVQKKEKDRRFLFVGYTLLFFIICFFPVTAKIIMKVCIGESVYWRMFWLLPTAVISAYTAVEIIMQMEKKSRRYLLLAGMLAVIVLTGTNVYNGAIFDRKQNNYKLPQDVVDICDIIEKDAAANGIEDKKLITVNDLVSSVRQYDANINMPYGNNAIKGLKIDGDSAKQIFRIMSSDTKNWEALAYYAALENCNYLAYNADDAAAQTLETLQYEKIGANANYYVYRRNVSAADYEGEWLISQYGNAEGNQLMFYTMQDTKGQLIVVDGGWVSDAAYVKSVIKSLGNHVDAWIVTHPHSDHAGAFTEIYPNKGKMKIDKVYAVDMAAPELCMENAPWDEVEVYEKFLKLDIPELSYVHAGDTLTVCGIEMEVFNAYDTYVDELSNDLLNDGSMMFRIKAKEQSMLFCADVGKRMSDYLLDIYGERLKSDYIQMGHHGNGGLKTNFYESIGAKGAFFDAPDWLMEDTSGRYTTPKNMYTMAKDGAAIYSFGTTPNQIVLK